MRFPQKIVSRHRPPRSVSPRGQGLSPMPRRRCDWPHCAWPAWARRVRRANGGVCTAWSAAQANGTSDKKRRGSPVGSTCTPAAKKAAAKAILRDEMAESWNAQATMGAARAPSTFAEIAPMKKEVQKDRHRYTTATVPMLTTCHREGRANKKIV